MPELPAIRIKKHHDKRIRSGHLWIFSNELETLPKDIPPGELVRVLSAQGEDLGSAFFNPGSLIAVRLLLCDETILSPDFFAGRITEAKVLREQNLPGEDSYRLVFGESDFLPGLVIDKYGDYFSVQMLSAGMDRRREEIFEAIRIVFPGAKGIVEKNSSRLRELEGLELRDTVAWGGIPESLVIGENGIRFSLSLMEGQKTGYFLDQKMNRKAVRELASGLRVLDCFCNQGGFALHAAQGGAEEALGIDISEGAVGSAAANAELNGLPNARFEKHDVFDYLKREREKKASWDMVVLDPPAFTKSRKNIPQAKRGYAEINRLALGLIPPGGYLVSSSCSQHILEEVFLGIIFEQAARSGRQLQLVFRGLQAPDHPVLLAMPETQYLKFFIFRVL